MTAAAEKAFKRVDEIFAQYPIAELKWIIRAPAPLIGNSVLPVAGA